MNVGSRFKFVANYNRKQSSNYASFKKILMANVCIIYPYDVSHYDILDGNTIKGCMKMHFMLKIKKIGVVSSYKNV